MKYEFQTSLPFIEKNKEFTKERSPKFSLNRDKFIQYLIKSIEIDLNEAQTLYEQLEQELDQFKGSNQMEFLERLLSSKIEHFQIKKAPSKPKVTLTENARIVLEKRYLKKNDKGEIIETPEQLFERVARAIADNREIEEKFYHMLSQLEFLPNSPTLMNAGTELGQLSACFVLPIEDSMESIFDTLKNTALIQKSGGGTGFNFSNLRPKNSPIQSTQGVSSGPLSFISIFNSMTNIIKQGGTRRGANMAILNIDHPDIVEFIHSKETPGSLTNFNISIAVTEKFMNDVKQGEAKATSLFNQIAQAAWKTGDPGLVFIDRMNNDNPTPSLGNIESTNPCGEQPLLPFESCNLGSINLNKVLKGIDIDWDKLEEIIKLAVRFLDNVIDVNKYPLQKIEDISRANRKIGLGVMGLADVLIKKNIPYNSTEALTFSKELMSFIYTKAHEASEELAKERGAFPNFKESTYFKAGKAPLRNATVTSIAPTGTLSIIADCSSGIEPIFATSFIRHVLEGEKLPESHPEAHVTAHDIAPEWHIRMQALFQKYSDSAVSKTVNLKHGATIEDVRKAYLLAHELGCKGITVFRDRSKETQVLTSAKETTFTVKPDTQGNIQITLNVGKSPSTSTPSQDLELTCPECHTPFQHEEGCTFCRACGYMNCS